MVTYNERLALVIVGEQASPTSLFTELRKHSVRLEKCVCTEDFLKTIEEKKPDLILIDLHKESEVCADIIKKIRDHNSNHEIPIITLIDDSSEQIQHVLTEGASDYITDTEEAGQIIEKVFAVLENRNSNLHISDIDITPPSQGVTNSGTRVFAIEDDPLLKNLLSVRFEKASFPHEFSSDGINVLQAIKQFKPEIIILDLMLPGIGGFEILEKVRGDADLHDLPVIVFSNRDTQEDRERAQKLGVEGFYVKAMTDLSELVQKIESITDNKNQTRR